MKKSLRKGFIVSLLAVLFLSLSCGLLSVTIRKVRADSPISDEFKMTGASIMLVPNGEESAIRFEVQCSKNDYALISGGATSGILILPTRFLNGEELELNKSYSEQNPRVKEINEFWVESGEVCTAYVYMYGIPESDYNTYLTARAFFTVGETTYYTNTVDRSIAYVASKALAAGEAGVEKYCNAIVDKVVDSSFAFEKTEYEVDSWEYLSVNLVNDQGLESKISVDNGNVENGGNVLRAVKEGTSTLTAKIGSKEATATVTVNKSLYESFEAIDLSQSTSIANGETEASFAYKSVNNYGGHVENLGLSIKANEYIQIAKPINFISASNMFTKMWFNEMTADEYKGTTLNLLFTSINNSEKRFVIRLRMAQDGFVYTSILGGEGFNYQYEIKNPNSAVGTDSGYINIRTNVNGSNVTHQIDNSYAFLINDIADYGDMYLTVFADKDIKIAFDYFGDALYSNFMTGYDALPTLSDLEKLSALIPSVATELVSTNLYAKGSTLNSFAYKNTSHPTVYGNCLGIDLKENEWITISEEYTGIANGWTSFVFNDMMADDYKGTTLTMVFVSKTDSTKKAALEFVIDENAIITLANVYGGELKTPIGCGIAGAEATFDVVSNVGSATSFQIRNKAAFTMPSLGDCYISFTTNKDIKFSLSYFNDGRRWDETQTDVYLGYDILVKYEWSADAVKDAAKLAVATPLDSSTFGGEIAKGTNANTFVYSKESADEMGIQIGAKEALTFAKTVQYKPQASTYMIRSNFGDMPDGTELTFTFISKSDSTKRFLYTAHFYTSGNYVTLAGTNLYPGDQRTPLGSSLLFQVNSSFGVQLDFGGFIVSDDITTMGEMILVISSNKEVNFTIDYLDDARPWKTGDYNALTDYSSHIA